MMESLILKVAGERRSVRKYTAEPVPRAMLDACLEAARLAPSACNSQPYSFIVADDPALKARLAAAAFSGLYSATRFAAAAPVLVAITGRRQNFTAWLGNRLQDINFRFVDMGIAGEHFVLAARELGLGTCWIGWFDKIKASKALGLPGGERAEILISVGWPAEEPQPRKRKTTDEFRRYNPGL
jgi:nitroreductase